MRRRFPDVPGRADYCVYWFRKAHDHSAAKTVTDRLKFILALESIVFDPETKGRLKERSQLHKISVGIKTWSDLIEENRARLQFFQEHLQHSADESASVRYLQERHSKYLEASLRSTRIPRDKESPDAASTD